MDTIAENNTDSVKYYKRTMPGTRISRINMNLRFISILSLILGISTVLISGQENGNRNLDYLGKLRPRHAKEIHSSMISVGAETMDRDYTIYDNWKEHLAPLGTKKARLQAGWAKTENNKGVYDWNWLDHIVFDIEARGVEPWMNIGYGNPAYTGGGGTRLGAAMPKNSESLQAWLRWVRGMVTRYKDVIDEWEIWNEGVPKNSMEDYVNLYIPTAEAIRGIQPDATLIALAMAGVHPEQADEFLKVMQHRGKIHLVDTISYHPYMKNPDNAYDQVARLRQVIAKYSDNITILQGENGAPSEFRKTKALNNYNWTELTQAKWVGRRMLGDLGRDIPTSIFSIVDLQYPDEINRKGLLHANEDQEVDHIKMAYYMFQNIAAVFDSTVDIIPDYAYRCDNNKSISLFAFENKSNGKQAVALWFDGDVPSDSNAKTILDFTFTQGRFNDPLYIDLLSGKVYKIKERSVLINGNRYTFKSIPVYDSPVLIIDNALVNVTRPTD